MSILLASTLSLKAKSVSEFAVEGTSSLRVLMKQVLLLILSLLYGHLSELLQLRPILVAWRSPSPEFASPTVTVSVPVTCPGSVQDNAAIPVKSCTNAPARHCFNSPPSDVVEAMPTRVSSLLSPSCYFQVAVGSAAIFCTGIEGTNSVFTFPVVTSVVSTTIS